MASIHSSRGKVYEKRTTVADEPTKHLESEGERLIKEMVLKQTGTQINLAEQLQQKKQFEKATELVPLTKYASGKISLKAFQYTAEKASYIEELKSSGLTDEEIEMAFAYDKGEDFFFTKYHKMEKSVLKQKLQEIFSKIEAGKLRLQMPEEKERGAKMSRHEQELGLAVKPASEETKLFMFALSCQQQENSVDLRPPEHPINQLKELEQQMFGHLTKKKRKKAKKRPTCDVDLTESSQVRNALSLWDCKEQSHTPVCNTVTVEDCSTSVQGGDESERTSLWDRKEPVSSPSSSNSRGKPPQVPRKYTCQPETLYTVRDGKIVTVTGEPKHCEKERESCSGQPFVLCDAAASLEYKKLSQEDIMGQRLSVDEIKQIPRFQNYEPGTPSKVLFVKNLAKQVKEADLVSVFAHLEDSGGKRIIYRLLTGKMQGQAFVTFPNTERATLALETINGFVLHNKPMVIQYGRSTGSE